MLTAEGSATRRAWDDEERRQLRSLVRDFTTREIVPHISAWEEAGELPRSLHQAAGRLGLLGAGFPEELGGSGDKLDEFAVAEQMVLTGASLGVCASLLSYSIATPHIVEAGDPRLVDTYVRPTLAGDLIGALAITEPDTGSDVAQVRTRAVRDGDHYVVNGAKTYITSGVRADYVTAAVRTGGPGHSGVSLLVIESTTPGFRVSRKLAKMGWLASDTAELSFDDVRVPVQNLVGEEGTGFRRIARQFQGERLVMALESAAAAQRCLELSLAWVKVRKTFGQPLSTRQVVRHKLAEMARQVDVARTYVHAVAQRWADGEEVSREVSMAKNTAVFALDHVVNEAVQLHGGLGYMRESEVERHYRDARIMGLGGGTNEIMNEIIAKRLGLD